MRISHLSLTNFRNYSRLELPLPAGLIVLHGDNAQGKTSLLEAIYYIATTRSQHATSDRQLINWLADDDPIPYTRIVAEVQTEQGVKRVDVTIVKEKQAGKQARLKKQIRLNGLPRRMMDILGHVRVVMFLPQDMNLVEGSPSKRRRYLDVTLCQVNTAYCQALSEYDKVLSQRNALLKQLYNRHSDSSELDFWDEKLTISGAAVVAGRNKLVGDLEGAARSIHRDLSGSGEHLRLRYLPGFDPSEEPDGQMSFDAGDLGAAALPQLPQKEIAARFMEALKANRSAELRRGITLIGPQRDEMRFIVNGHDLGLYGSRGQNRTAVLALKLAELDWMRRRTGEWPILLLDEVAAELDPHRRAYLMAQVAGADQVLMTTTEPGLFPDDILQKAERWHVEAGHITVEEAGK